MMMTRRWSFLLCLSLLTVHIRLSSSSTTAGDCGVDSECDVLHNTDYNSGTSRSLLRCTPADSYSVLQEKIDLNIVAPNDKIHCLLRAVSILPLEFSHYAALARLWAFGTEKNCTWARAAAFRVILTAEHSSSLVQAYLIAARVEIECGDIAKSWTFVDISLLLLEDSTHTYNVGREAVEAVMAILPDRNELLSQSRNEYHEFFSTQPPNAMRHREYVDSLSRLFQDHWIWPLQGQAELDGSWGVLDKEQCQSMIPRPGSPLNDSLGANNDRISRLYLLEHSRQPSYGRRSLLRWTAMQYPGDHQCRNIVHFVRNKQVQGDISDVTSQHILMDYCEPTQLAFGKDDDSEIASKIDLSKIAPYYNLQLPEVVTRRKSAVAIGAQVYGRLDLRMVMQSRNLPATASSQIVMSSSPWAEAISDRSWISSVNAKLNSLLWRRRLFRTHGRKIRLGIISKNFGCTDQLFLRIGETLSALDRDMYSIFWIARRQTGRKKDVDACMLEFTKIHHHNSVDHISVHEDEPLPEGVPETSEIWMEMLRSLALDIVIYTDQRSCKERSSSFSLLGRGIAPVQIQWRGYMLEHASPVFDYQVTSQGEVSPPFLAARSAMHQQMAYLPYTSLTCGNCISHNSTDDSDQLEPTLNRGTVLQETSDYPTTENPKTRALDICVLTSGVTSLRYSKYTFTAILRVIAENKNTRLLLVRIADPAVMSPMFIYRIARNMGIEPERIHVNFRKKDIPYPQYFELLRQSCDLVLDSYPYGMQSSAMDVLYAGVPILAWEGQRLYQRISANLNRQIGLEIMVVNCPTDPSTCEQRFIDRAGQLLRNDGQELRQVQLLLRQQRHHPIFSSPSSTAAGGLNQLLQEALAESLLGVDVVRHKTSDYTDYSGGRWINQSPRSPSLHSNYRLSYVEAVNALLREEPSACTLPAQAILLIGHWKDLKHAISSPPVAVPHNVHQKITSMFDWLHDLAMNSNRILVPKSFLSSSLPEQGEGIAPEHKLLLLSTGRTAGSIPPCWDRHYVYPLVPRSSYSLSSTHRNRNGSATLQYFQSVRAQEWRERDQIDVIRKAMCWIDGIDELYSYAISSDTRELFLAGWSGRRLRSPNWYSPRQLVETGQRFSVVRDMLVDVKLAHSGGRPSSWNELNIFIPPLAFPRISAAHVSYPDHAMLRKRRANWALRAFGQTPHLPLNVSSDEAARSVEPG